MKMLNQSASESRFASKAQNHTTANTDSVTEEDTDRSFNIEIDPVIIDMSRRKLNESSSQVELYHDSSSSSANEFKGIVKQP